MPYTIKNSLIKQISALSVVIIFGFVALMTNRSSADPAVASTDQAISSICSPDSTELVLSVLNKNSYPVSGISFTINKTTPAKSNYISEISNIITVDNTSLCLPSGTYSVKTGSSERAVTLVAGQGKNVIFKANTTSVNMTAGYKIGNCKTTKSDLSRYKFQVVDFATGKCLGSININYLPKDKTATFHEFKDKDGVTHSIPITDYYSTSDSKGLFNIDKPSDAVVVDDLSQSNVRRIINDGFYQIHSQPTTLPGSITVTISNPISNKLIVDLYNNDEYSEEKEITGSGSLVFGNLSIGDYSLLISSEKEGDINIIDGDNIYWSAPGIDTLTVYAGSNQKIQINQLEQE